MKTIIYSPKGTIINDFDCEDFLDNFINNSETEIIVSNDKIIYYFIRYVKTGIVNPKNYEVFVYDTETIKLQFDKDGDLTTEFDFFYDKHANFMIKLINRKCELETELAKHGYINFKNIPSRNWCCIAPFLYTWAIICNVSNDTSENHYDVRYCFEHKQEAIESLNEWTGIGHPPGNWIKHKGIDGDYSNPNYSKY